MATPAASKTFAIPELVENIIRQLITIILRETSSFGIAEARLAILKMLCIMPRISKSFQATIRDTIFFRTLTFNAPEIKTASLPSWFDAGHNPILFPKIETMLSLIGYRGLSFEYSSRRLRRKAQQNGVVWKTHLRQADIVDDDRLKRVQADKKQGSWRNMRMTYKEVPITIEVILIYDILGDCSKQTILPPTANLGDFFDSLVGLGVDIVKERVWRAG